MSLDRFFAAMAPMLEGKASPQSVVDALGPSRSRVEDIGFYATLVERNHFKICNEVFPALRLLLEREQPGRWPQIVRSYRDAHPADHRNPNRFAAKFADFLRQMREAGEHEHPIFEELADLIYIRHLAFTGHDPDGEAYDGRVFVRQYSHPTSDYFFALVKDAAAPLPQAKPQVVFVYRHLRDASLHHFLPNAAGLAALALRQGIAELPAMFGALTQTQLDNADEALVERGVFGPEPTRDPSTAR